MSNTAMINTGANAAKEVQSSMTAGITAQMTVLLIK